MKLNVVRRKLIKPCTPTPQSLSKYKISFKDELIAPMNVGVLLFYRSKPKRISHLEESLAKILVQFYPLAGRYIKKDYTVDCGDQGAEFVEAEVFDIELIDLIRKTKTEQLNDLLPRQSNEVDEATDPLLSVQITEFKSCGGLVIAVSVSHRIFDGSSIGTFIAAWSSANRGIITIIPSFDSPSLFPGKNLSYHPDIAPSETGEPRIVLKRILFHKEAITRLRSKLRPKDGKKMLSRVRAVCALVAKALIGVEQAKCRKSRPCLIVQSVNMRDRTIPPLPKHSCGNLVIHSVTQCMAATTHEIENGSSTKDWGVVQEIAHQVSDAIETTVSDCGEMLSLVENGFDNIILNPEANLIERSQSGDVIDLWFTDWSKFGFYEVDFGWGKPVWVGVGKLPVENLTVLMNNKEGDGIEAWVHLNHSDISYFDQDQIIKLFTS